MTAAWIAALSGQKEEMDRRLAQLSNMSNDGSLSDGTTSVESVIALIHGLLGFYGPSDMLASARQAAELQTDGRSSLSTASDICEGRGVVVDSLAHTLRHLLGRGIVCR